MEDELKLIQRTTETRLIGLECRVAGVATDMSKVTSCVRDLRGRMDDDLRTMRQEMRDGDYALRGAGEERFRALYKQVSALREEMHEGLRSIRKELWEKEIRNTKIWALVFLAIFLGMAAKGFDWI